MTATNGDREFKFRAILLKIQDLIDDDDRRKLHFMFGENIPRQLQSSGSLESSLEVLQTLQDRFKISKDDCSYLVAALEAIQRLDCAQRLRDYQNLVPQEITEALAPQQQVHEKNALPSFTIADLLNNLEEDSVVPIVSSSPSSSFKSPDPAPMDFVTIDLRPFEDDSIPWTEDYSTLLNLKYPPRAYQIEIVRDAVRSGSTIICLRTGSGKTFIASLLIKYNFIKKSQTDPNTRFLAIFFVPRKAIRHQQAQAIVDIGNLKVQICEDDQTVDNLIGNSHVIVTTPQKVVNSLKQGKLRLSQIDLMVFDECHNTSGGNPYCELMKFYLCPSRKEQSTDADPKKPHIVGLTATISAKDADEKRQPVYQNLVSLCSKLACSTISTVCNRDNLDEINREISRPSNDQFETVINVEYNSFFKEYKTMLENLINQIKRLLDDHQQLDGQIIGSSGFIGQGVLLKQGFEKAGQTANVIICDYLLLLTKKFSALNDLPFDMVIKHISDKIDEYHKGLRRPIPIDNLIYDRCKAELNVILEKCAEQSTTNSKLDTLIMLLKRHAVENAKGLVLVRTTFYAKTLFDYLANHPDLVGTVKPAWLVGQSSADHAKTIREQETELRKFGGDECNVLIATDIVQEGLDIPTCSYVIRYEFVSDEIGTIQSRGRARAKNSSYYLITECESINHKRERNNKLREDDTELAIAEWPGMDKEAFRGHVEGKTTKLINDWEADLLREQREKATLQRLGKKDGVIGCRRCNQVLGELAWLKRRNTTYFIMDPQFFDKTKCELKSTFENFQTNLIMGKVICHCGLELGGCQKFMDRPELGIMCALKCKQVKFYIEGEKSYFDFAQWSKNNRFDVEVLEEV